MSRIYTSAADHINNHPYPVMVSSLYAPVMPQSFLMGELEPVYYNPTPQHPVRSMLAIKFLIDLHSTRQSFTVIEDMDVIRIFHSLDAYLIEIADSISINPNTRLYAEKVLNLRKDAYRNFVRMLNHHPEWKAAYMQGVERLIALFELFAVPDFSKHRKSIDPIEELRDPPVTLEKNKQGTTGQIGVPNTSILPVPYHYA